VEGGPSRKKYDLIILTSEEGIIDMIRGGEVLQEKNRFVQRTNLFFCLKFPYKQA
jgi:hypothetical protein